ncbi:MAG: hypothetical protein C1O27_001399 [Chloroflexi bacterium]|jgi:hypothetical protein|nr:MAG: hypothetical protein C1O27_001399 [Chloroflexota bacterium]
MDENGSASALTSARILHSAFAASPLIYLIVLRVSFSASGELFSIGDAVLFSLVVVLGVLGAALMLAGLYLPPILARVSVKQSQKPENAIVLVFLIRAACYELPAIFGLIVGLVGSRWELAFPFIAISLVALLLSFPRTRHIEGFREEAGS